MLALGTPTRHPAGMCNLYNITSSQSAIIELTRAMRDKAGNLEPALDLYPDYPAPIVRNGEDGTRELVWARWGMPTPKQYLKGSTDSGVTNIRNPKSPHWRGWLNEEHRCVVPATSFCEWTGPRGSMRKVWFALNEDKPLFVFAGIWTRWHGTRKKKEGEGDFELFGFLTTEANAVVKPIHAKAMPVILTSEEDIETWLTAPIEAAIELQRPLPDNGIMILDEA